MDLSPALEGLTEKRRIYVEARLQGMSPKAACMAAGVAPNQISNYEGNPDVKAAIAKGHAISAEHTGLTREKVTAMLMDAYRMAETATEMVMAARELGKLHGLYAPT